MRIQSQATPVYTQVATAAKASPAPGAAQDTVVSTTAPDAGIYKPQATAPKSNAGTKMALQFAGIGVMFGGMMASMALPHSFVGAGIIGSMCGGLALMALANNN